MQVWMLFHSYERDGCEQIKTIGVYSSKTKAEEAIRRLRDQPGFADHPDGFSVDPYQVDMDYWQEGFVTE